jgi:hypothetical protein
MRIDSSGNVGIGVTTVNGKLDVKTASDSKIIFNDGSTTGNVRLEAVNVAYSAYKPFEINASVQLFAINGTERMRIDSSGNVGISTGNLNFSGTGQRITGDFSNATVANRVFFQTSTVNGVSRVEVIPNGTATTSALFAYNSSDPANSSTFNLQCNSTEASLRAGFLGTGTNQPMTFYTGGSERVRIDTSGNVGIGTTSLVAKLQVNGTGAGGTIFAQHPGNNSFGTIIQVSTTGGTDNPVISLENYNGGSPVRYGISCTDDGSLAFMSGAYYSGFGTERARIDASGNFGLGTLISLPSGLSKFIAIGDADSGIGQISDGKIAICSDGQQKIVVNPGTAASGSTENLQQLRVRTQRPNNGNFSDRTVYLEDYAAGTNAPAIGFHAPNNGVAGILKYWGGSGEFEFRNSNDSDFISCRASAFNVSSDYRLKEDIQPMTGALAKVALFKPVTYKWKAGDKAGQGFIAHELSEVLPEAVTGEKDGVDAFGNLIYQGIDTSFLVATLTAAIQEQQALIQSLTARLDAANL